MTWFLFAAKIIFILFWFVLAVPGFIPNHLVLVLCLTWPRTLKEFYRTFQFDLNLRVSFGTCNKIVRKLAWFSMRKWVLHWLNQWCEYYQVTFEVGNVFWGTGYPVMYHVAKTKVDWSKSLISMIIGIVQLFRKESPYFLRMKKGIENFKYLFLDNVN
jgi:hypothetical protein